MSLNVTALLRRVTKVRKWGKFWGGVRAGFGFQLFSSILLTERYITESDDRHRISWWEVVTLRHVTQSEEDFLLNPEVTPRHHHWV